MRASRVAVRSHLSFTRSSTVKTQYYTATTLDGFIAGEDHSLDWLFSLGDINATSYPDFIKGVGALAMGSGTYEWMMRNSDRVSETTAEWLNCDTR